MAVILLDGAEHGIAPSSAGSGFWDVVNTPAAYSISTTTFKNGARALRCNASTQAAYLQKNLDAGTQVAVAHFWYRRANTPAPPSGTLIPVFECYTGTGGTGHAMGLDQLNTTGFPFQTAYWNDSSGLVVGQTPSTAGVDQDRWYLVELIFDASSSPWQIQWRIDGVAQTSSSQNITGAASDLRTLRFGWHQTYTMDSYLDDVIVGNATADYPFGEHKILAYSPSGVGTHNLDAATSAYFFKDISATETALTTSETTSYQQIDDVPLDGDSDHVLVRGSSPTLSFIDPTADGASNAWTKSTGTAGWSLLDDAVRQPTAPTTGSDRITSSTAGQLQDLVFPNTLTYNATATYTLWVHATPGNRRGADTLISVNDSTFANSDPTVPATTGATDAWFSRDITTLITSQGNLDGLRVRLSCSSIAGGGATACAINAVYLEQSAPAAPTTAHYLEYELADTAETGGPGAVRAILVLRNDSGTTANKITAKLRDGASDGAIVTDLDIASTTTIYKTATFATKPSGGAWTVAALNALKLRWGFTNDPDSTPRLESAIVEAAFRLSVENPPPRLVMSPRRAP